MTPRAERIRVQLATTVTQLEQLFASETFDPAAAAQSFRVAISDYTFPMFGSTLVHTILTVVPVIGLVLAKVYDSHLPTVDRRDRAWGATSFAVRRLTVDWRLLKE